MIQHITHRLRPWFLRSKGQWDELEGQPTTKLLGNDKVQ